VAVILRYTRRIRLLLSTRYPYQDLFQSVVAKLQPGLKNSRMRPRHDDKQRGKGKLRLKFTKQHHIHQYGAS
jgi:hypothetical protein